MAVSVGEGVMSKRAKEDRARAVSAVIPTRDRADMLGRMLQSLAGQTVLPAELIVIDASSDDSSRDVVEGAAKDLERHGCRVVWKKAAAIGAAVQRNEGVTIARHPVIAFFDDDIVFEPECLNRLVAALESDPSLGGVNAMISNQRYSRPGMVSETIFRLMAGKRCPSYAGRLLGPAVNLLPEDDPSLPDVVPVEWLNTTCTLYRRAALPEPPFPDYFTGYSLMEDVALSVRVGAHWNLANARTARIFHDSQTGDHKRDPGAVAQMELLNRYYVMTRVLERRRAIDHAKLALWEIFQTASSAARLRFRAPFWRIVRGKGRALAQLLSGGPSPKAA